MSLFNDFTSEFTCFDDTLNVDECADLYNIALFGGIVDDRTIMNNIYGPHKDTMRQLIDNQKHESGLMFDAFSLHS